jgi:hypothetical protein
MENEGEQMRVIPSLVLGLLIAVPAWADKDTNPADYQLTAHVNSAIFTHTTAPSNSRVTELQIGNLIYIANEICKEATVGASYPARIEGRKISLLVAENKVCRFRIDGTKESH